MLSAALSLAKTKTDKEQILLFVIQQQVLNSEDPC